jgi:AAA domain
MAPKAPLSSSPSGIGGKETTPSEKGGKETTPSGNGGKETMADRYLQRYITAQAQLDIDDIVVKINNLQVKATYGVVPPENLKFQEPVDHYPQSVRSTKDFYEVDGYDCEWVHADYRGTDHPAFASDEVKSGRDQRVIAVIETVRPFGNKNATLHSLGSLQADTKSGQVGEKRSSDGMDLDCKDPKKARKEITKFEDKDEDAVSDNENPSPTPGPFKIRMQFIYSTQYPGISLNVFYEGKILQFVIPAACLSYDEPKEKIGFEWYSQDMDKFEDFTPAPNFNTERMKLDKLAQYSPELRKLGEEKKLMLTRITFDAKTRPFWSGISQSQIVALESKANKDLGSISPVEQFIVLTYRATELNLFSGWAPTWKNQKNHGDEILALQTIADMYRFFQGTLYLTRKLGEFWYYRLCYARLVYENAEDPNAVAEWDTCVEKALLQDKFPFKKVQPPRWLVTEWAEMVKMVDEMEQFAGLIPKKWKAFPHGRFWAKTESALFYQRINLERERLAEISKADEMNQLLRGGKTQGIFREVMPGSYMVEIFVDAETGSDSSFRKLPLQCPVLVSSRKKNGPLELFQGQVLEDFGQQSASLVVAVHGPRGYGVDDDTKIPIKLECSIQEAPLNRTIYALDLSTIEQERTQGAHIRSICFGGPVPYHQLETVLSPFTTKWGKFILNECSTLNEMQQRAAISAVFNANGVAIIHGGPGTGKTRSSSAIVAAATHCGLKVMVTGVTNEAVDEGLTKLLQLMQQVGTTNAMPIRYRSAFRRPFGSVPKVSKSASQQGNDLEKVDEMDAVRKLVQHLTTTGHLNHPGHGWHYKRQQFIEKQIVAAATKDKGLRCPAATELQVAKEQLKVARANQQDLSTINELARKVWKLNEQVDRDFLIHAVNVVYVTCNSSTAEVLARFYKFDVLVCEEAAQGTMGDFSTALAMHRESVKLLVLSGDHNQGTPVVISNDENEADQAGKRSFMDILVDDPGRRFEVYHLDTQYRMHPDISALNSEIFYRKDNQRYINDAVISSSCPAMDEKILKFLNDSLGGLGYRGSRILAINVEGNSSIYERTASSCNKVEADAVISFLRHMSDSIASQDIKNAAALEETGGMDVQLASEEPFTTGVLTPYTGQERMLNLVFSKTDFSNIGITRAKTTRSAQGNEWHLTCVSLVKAQGSNATEVMKIGWTADPGLLNVNTSRARNFSILFGNFKDWCRVLQSPVKSTPGKALAHVRKFKMVLQHLWDENLIFDYKAFESHFTKGKVDGLRANFKKYVSSLPIYEIPKPGQPDDSRVKIRGPTDRAANFQHKRVAESLKGPRMAVTSDKKGKGKARDNEAEPQVSTQVEIDQLQLDELQIDFSTEAIAAAIEESRQSYRTEQLTSSGQASGATETPTPGPSTTNPGLSATTSAPKYVPPRLRTTADGMLWSEALKKPTPPASASSAPKPSGKAVLGNSGNGGKAGGPQNQRQGGQGRGRGNFGGKGTKFGSSESK